MMFPLSKNERAALATALENYANGNGMEDGDEDEVVLDNILFRLETE